MSEFRRRHFLKSMMGMAGGAVLNSPLQLFISNMMMDFLGNGVARAAGEDGYLNDYKMIHFSIAGGASTYHWDNPLQPNGNDILVPNKTAISRFKRLGGGAVEGEYASIPFGGYYLPYTWSSMIPTTSGSPIPMTELSRNMLMMRGLDVGIDSHAISPRLHAFPTPSASLTGLVSEASLTSIPAVGSDGTNLFGSSKGLSFTESNGNNSPLELFLNPFTRVSGEIITSSSSADIESAFDAALLGLANDKTLVHSMIPSTTVNRISAKNLLKKNFGNLQQAYNNLKTKYEGLISQSFGDPSLRVLDLDDIALAGDNSVLFNLPESKKYTDSDLRLISNYTTTIGNLANSMAIAEFMITEGYTSSVCSTIHGWNNLNVNGNNRFGLPVDSAHFTGSYVMMVLFARYYRAFSACLYELVGALKRTPVSGGLTMFDRTAIAITGDFNRSARADGSCSDHAPTGSNYTVISGMVPSLTVVGNITSIPSGLYAGTWGQAGDLTETGKHLGMGNVASTLSKMLNFKNPSPSELSLITKDALTGKIAPNVARPKNVA